MVRVSSGVDSKQDYQTPAAFIAAVEKRFGKIHFDLAANYKNRQAHNYFTDDVKDPVAYGHDALSQDWRSLGAELEQNTVLWLNPPFQNIEPWAKKCRGYIESISQCTQASTLCFLVPASVGSDWFKESVWNWAYIYFLNGRLSFDGKAPYGKDCLLAVYRYSMISECAIWDWRKDEIRW